MTDARLGGLGREALVSDTGQARLGGIAREALVSGTGLIVKSGSRSAARGTLSVVFAGVILAATATARSFTRTTGRLSINLGARITASSRVRAQLPSNLLLAGRATARSRGSIMRSNPATSTAWASAKSRMAAVLDVGVPVITKQYAVSIS